MEVVRHEDFLTGFVFECESSGWFVVTRAVVSIFFLVVERVAGCEVTVDLAAGSLLDWWGSEATSNEYPGFFCHECLCATRLSHTASGRAWHSGRLDLV